MSFSDMGCALNSSLVPAARCRVDKATGSVCWLPRHISRERVLEALIAAKPGRLSTGTAGQSDRTLTQPGTGRGSCGSRDTVRSSTRCR